jgi:O-antigen/teichoic acid export membrane protein
VVVPTVKANFLIQIATFFSSILIIRFLGSTGRGELALVLLYPQLISNITNFGFDRSVAIIGGTKELHYPVLTISFITFLISIPACVAAYFFIVFNVTDLAIRSLSTTYLIYVPAVYFFTISVSYLNGIGNFTKYNLSRVAYYIANLVLICVSGLLFYGTEVMIKAIVYSSIATQYLVLGIAAWSIRRIASINMPFEWTLFKKDFISIVKLTPKYLAPVIVVQLSLFSYQIVTNRLLGVDALGILIVLYTYSRLASPIGSAIGATFFRYGIIDSKKDLQKNIRMGLITYFICFVLLGCSANLIVPLLFGTEFTLKDLSVYILLSAYFFAIQSDPLAEYLYGNKLVAIDVLSRVMYLLFFIFLAINLGPSYGIEGICIGMLLGEIIRFSILIKYTANSMRINTLSLLLITYADIKDFVIGCRALLFSLKSKNK